MTEQKKQSVGERLLTLRNKKSLTQEDLAEQLDVSRQSISKWELNKTLPDVEKLIQLSELYEVSIDYLVKGEENFTEEGIDEEEEKKETNIEQKDIILGEPELPEVKPVDKEALVKKIIFLFCMLMSGILSVFILVFSVKLVFSHTFRLDDKKQELICVDRIYEQYTKAEVSGMAADGAFFKANVWLDIPGVRENDYIHYYYNEKDSRHVAFRYYLKTILIPFIFGIIFLIFFIVFFMEWKSLIKIHGGAYWEEGKSKENGKENR